MGSTGGHSEGMGNGNSVECLRDAMCGGPEVMAEVGWGLEITEWAQE